MAVSDTLFEALDDIRSYLDMKPPIYQGEARAMIYDLCNHMQSVMDYLDTVPGTKRETVAENETRK